MVTGWFLENSLKVQGKTESETVGYCCVSDDGGLDREVAIRCDLVEGTINSRKS